MNENHNNETTKNSKKRKVNPNLPADLQGPNVVVDPALAEVYDPIDPFEGLTPFLYCFVCEYMKDFCGVRAAERAGYSGSYHTLASIASQNLRRGDVQRVIKRKLQENSLDADSVISMLATQARGLGPEFFDDSGELNFQKLKETGLTTLIEGVTPTKQGMSYKIASASRARELLAKYHHLFTDTTRSLNITLNLNDLTSEQLERIQLGEDPMTVLAQTKEQNDT